MRCYIDDIIVFSKNVKEHREHHTIMLECLVKHGLMIIPNKCTFFDSEVEYLGI